MTIALVVSAHAAGVNGATISGANTTNATLIALATAYQAGTSPTVADTKSNTYTGLTAQTGTGDVAVRWHYCQNPAVGSGHDFTITQIGGANVIAMLAFSGAGVFDLQNGNADVGPATSLLGGSITPSEDNEVILTALGLDAANTPSIDAGYTIAEHQAFVGGSNYGLDAAYLVQTTAGATNPTWSWATGCRAGIAVASFKIAVAATATRGVGIAR